MSPSGFGVFGLLVTVVFIAVLTAAAVMDLRSRRIPNPLVIAGLAAGLLLRLPLGVGGVFDGVLGAALALGVALPLFALGALGGGDGKLLMVVGAFMGPGRFAGALLAIAVLGGLLALADATRRGVILPVLHNTGGLVRRWLTFGRRGESRSLESPGAVTVPYGVAIAAGAIGWWFWGVPVL